MKITTVKVANHRGTLGHMARLARQYKNDAAVRQWMGKTSQSLFQWLQKIYKTEKGEILQRPDVTATIGRADCDDQSIFLAAALLASGVPEHRIIFALAGRRAIGHVFVIYQRPDGSQLWLDALPDRRYGEQYPYPILEKIRLSEV